MLNLIKSKAGTYLICTKYSCLFIMEVPIHSHLAKILKYFKNKNFISTQFSMIIECIFSFWRTMSFLTCWRWGIASIFEEKHAKQKNTISCPYGQLIYIILVLGSKQYLKFYKESPPVGYSEGDSLFILEEVYFEKYLYKY